MALYYKKKILLNGKELKDLNGKRVRELNVGNDTYIVPEFYDITIRTNNDSSTTVTWHVPENTFISISGDDITATDIFGDSYSINAGTKTDYAFDGWDTNSFYANSDTTIEGTWTPDTPIEHKYVTIRWTLQASTSGTTTTYSVSGTRWSVDAGLDLNLLELRIPQGSLSPSITVTGSVNDGDGSATVEIEVVYNGVTLDIAVFDIYYGDDYDNTDYIQYQQS